MNRFVQKAKAAERDRTMFRLLDTETHEVIAHFATKEYARATARMLSREQHRPMTVLFGSNIRPIARYIDGAEIAVTATIHWLASRDGAPRMTKESEAK